MFGNKPDQVDIDPNKDYTADLVGEGKKYADIAAMARAIMFKDQHITRIETENSGMREDFAKWREQQAAVPSLQELVDQLRAERESGNNPPPVNDNNNQSQQIDMKEIEALFKRNYQEEKSLERRTQNEVTVLSKLKERYGPNYETHLKTQMDEIGMSQDEALELAREKPQAFSKLFLAERQTENFQAPPQSTRRGDSFAPTGAAKRDESYYESLRKEKPDIYWSPKTQNQMHEDAIRLGEAFFV